MASLLIKIKQIPKLPGVYLFKNKENDIIYIGKALNLHNRVNSYFNKNNDIKTLTLVKKIAEINFFVTNNEIEALLLENNLIKEHLPKYNIRLKDSKSFPMLKITKENLPRIIKCREKRNDSDEYFGPFVDVYKLKLLQKIFTKIFKIRTCKKKFKKPYKYKVCLNYHIGLCSGPCASLISEEDYNKNINIIREILKGKTKNIITVLKAEMNEFSSNKNYEKAALVRDQIQALMESDPLQIMDNESKENNDYLGIYSDYESAAVAIVMERNGKITGTSNFMISNIIDYDSVLNDFLNAYYLNITFFPETIFIDKEPEDSAFSGAMKLKHKINIQIKKPSDIKNKKILLLAKENAEIYFQEKKERLEKIDHLRELKKILNLSKLPRVIEGIDVATLQGKYNVASLVVFTDGKKDLKNYRQYNIEEKPGPNDYFMIEEVTARRYQKMKNENTKFPDLIMIDGGKGQVSSCVKILDILNIDIPVIGLAKKNEHIFLKNKNTPLILPKDSYALKLLQRIRDEAHRFSNTRLRIKYKKEVLKSKLLSIPGLGENRINELFKNFGSISGLEKAGITEIAKLKGIGDALAEKIFQHLHL